MRPEKLILSAFGPYASRQEIPFYRLGKKGIYVISRGYRRRKDDDF